jgi:hypothetical protein
VSEESKYQNWEDLNFICLLVLEWKESITISRLIFPLENTDRRREEGNIGNKER